MLRSEIRSIFVDTFKRYNQNGIYHPRDLVIEFYHYTSLKHTARIRNQIVYVRLSDQILGADREVFESLSHVLMAQLFGRRCPRRFEEKYDAYGSKLVNSNDYLETLKKQKKVFSGPLGRVYDLNEILHRVSNEYFEGRFLDVTIGWSKRKALTRIGHYDSVHHVIVISKVLDDVYVPEFLVEYIVYHELLHVKHPMQFHTDRRSVIHSRAFKIDEKKFKRFDESEKWLKESLPKLIRRSGLKKRVKQLVLW